MTLIRGRSHFHKKCSFVTFFDSFSLLQLDKKLFDQLVGPPRANLLIVVILATALFIPKYTKKELLQIFETVLEAWASTTFKKFWNKPLKAHSLDMYYEKSHMECYNFYQ